MSPAEQAAHDRHLARARVALDAADWNVAVDEGRAADVDALLESALYTL
jgi:hypothetical protein